MSLNDYLYEKFGFEVSVGEVIFTLLIYIFVVSSFVGVFGIIKYLYYSIIPSTSMQMYFLMSFCGFVIMLALLWICIKDIAVIHEPKQVGNKK